MVLVVSGRTARLWRISEQRVLFEFRHEGEINAAAFTKDGALVATAGDKPFLQVWRTIDGAPTGPPIPYKREVTEVDLADKELWRLLQMDAPLCRHRTGDRFSKAR